MTSRFDKFHRSAVFLGPLAFLGTLLAAQEAAAVVPGTITHQGRLFDADGAAVSDTLDVTFTIYDSPNGGSAVWTETLSVAFDEGYYSVELGQDTPFDSTVIDGSTRYMGVTVGTDDEMSPRGTVGSVPYAMLANDVNGDINPNSVNIGGAPVIDENGQWVGDPSGLVGPAGPAGPPGAAGPAGPAGAAGAVGPAGPAGPAGATGAIGPAGPAGATGAVGPAGPAGATGAVGPAGPAGATGAVGPAGPAGATGAVGPAGATGAIGPAGPAGATGIVATSSIAGAAPANIAGAAANYVFVGPTVVVAVAAGQRITGTAVAALATAAGTATGDPGMCYQLAAGTITNFVGGNYTTMAWTNVRTGTSAAATVSGLPAGNYTVGFCVRNTGATALSVNDWVNGWVQVTN